MNKRKFFILIFFVFCGFFTLSNISYAADSYWSITDDVTGGDCRQIGNWDVANKTCTLTTDVYQTIQIDSDSITLDGVGHLVKGSNVNSGYGIYTYFKKNIIIKNLKIENSATGIALMYSTDSIVSNNTINLNHTGIFLDYSNSNILRENVADVNIETGILIRNSNSNVLNNNSIYRGRNGIFLANSDNNIIIDNISSFNKSPGIYLWGSADNNTFYDNTFSNNFYGSLIYKSSNNKFYNNNFIGNINQTYIYPEYYIVYGRTFYGWPNRGNVFNLEFPIGGNYWSHLQGCSNINSDNFCDSYYWFNGGQDKLPWAKQDGWKISTNQPPAISNLNQYKSDGSAVIAEGGTVMEESVVFKAVLNDADNDQVKFQIELKEFNQVFDGQNILESDFVVSGGEVVVRRDSLIDGQYKWRTRAIDSQGNAGDWQEFGSVGDVDFEVKLSLSLKAAKLAKLVIDGAYLGDGETFGGKGWDMQYAEYVNKDSIFNGYNYWNNKLRKIAFGAGLDCSGLIQWAYNYSFDPKKILTRNAIRYDGADGQYRNNTETIAEVDLKPGDLLFLDKGNDNFMDHVAMYIGESGGYDIVEAFSPDKGITTININKYKIREGFNIDKHIRRVVFSPSIGGQVKVGSPIDITVTDPDGFTITPNTVIQTDSEYLREIPGELYYTENILGVDGRPEDIVYWPKQKIGNYIIKVLPEDGVALTETYSLELIVGEQTIILADDIPLNQMPLEDYGVNIASDGAINTFIPVLIDIKPDSDVNSINLKSNGVIPVAIFGSQTFDVKQIDSSTIKLANSGIKLKSNNQPMISYEDINGDSFVDMVVHINIKDLQLTASDIKANLEGNLFDSSFIKGLDSVRIVP